MPLPAELLERIRTLTSSVTGTDLRVASQRVTEAYRGGTPAPLQTRPEQLAYLVARFPATYAAIHEALDNTAAQIEGFAPKSMLDLGSGPGTAVWAALDLFPGLEHVEAVERNSALRGLAIELASASSSQAAKSVQWSAQDLREWRAKEKYDLVVASYSMGELSSNDRSNLIQRAWGVCTGVLVVVEPGTRDGFRNVVEIRKQLMEAGSELAAPCPGRMECPMKLSGDWCHFSVRVERTAEHRRLKQGELGYEDEKFSYVAGTRLPVRSAKSRVVRHPMRYSGHTKLQLCTIAGLKEQTVTRSQKELYRKVKRAAWGSVWED